MQWSAIITATTLAVLPRFGAASDLQQMQRDLREEQDNNTSSEEADGEDSSSAAGSEADGDEDSWLAEILYAVLWTGGSISVARVSPEGSTWEGAVAPRKDGEALVPFARLDASAFYSPTSDEDTFGGSLRGELGWGPLAVAGEFRSLNDGVSSLELGYAHGFYRMSFGSAVEFDLGLGAAWLHVDETLTGFSFSTPLRVHPGTHWGLEVVPVWTAFEGGSLADYTFQGVFGGDAHSVTVGWRALRSENAKVDGPQLGYSVRY